METSKGKQLDQTKSRTLTNQKDENLHESKTNIQLKSEDKIPVKIEVQTKPNLQFNQQKEKIIVSKVELDSYKVGRTVVHETFRKGLILFRDSNYIIVKFDLGGEKKFRFPDSIVNGYIKLENTK